MSPAQPTTARMFAFGDLETGLWGIAASSPAGIAASFAEHFELDAGAPDSESLLAAAGVELSFSPTCEPAPFLPAPDGVSGDLQLCEVRGALHVGGAEREVACFGVRAELTLPVTNLSSARVAAAWFSGELGFALVSTRPRKASGHDSDLVTCAFVDGGHPLEIDEPRFSTTYSDAAVPLRAGLELWPVEHETEHPGEPGEPAEPEPDQEVGGDAEDEVTDSEGGPPPYYPRRIAGENERDASRLALPVATARADLFRWRTRGREGAGVYVLAPAP